MGETSPCGKFPLGSSFPRMSQLNRDRLRALLEERGLTPRALSRAIGDNPYLVRDILAGKSKNPRSDTISKIAEELKVPVQELLTGTAAPSSSVTSRVDPLYLPVRYRVQAGLWYEVDAEESPVQITHPVTPNPKYAGCNQWLELVVGDSVNEKIPDGQYAHVVDIWDISFTPTTGQWVVVERRRGGTRERTIKQVEVRNGDVVLMPRSTNARWSDPVNLTEGTREGEEIEVAIVGLVIGAYNPDF